MSGVRRIAPGPGQESVWDYPRPPRLEPVAKRLRVVLNGRTVAETERGWRVLETSHPPVYYLPREDVHWPYLRDTDASSWCEFKGRAVYWDVVVDGVVAPRAAWGYPDPAPGFAAMKDAVAFYAGPMDGCWVGDEKAEPQPGGFYGGWITKDVVGPFKGAPGTWGW